jgi:LPS export ABC transporter protein LptC
MRKHLRLLLVGVVVLLLGGIAFLIGNSLRVQWKQEAVQSALDLIPNVAQRLQDFHRIKTQDGRTVWEVAAREAQYLEDEDRITVTEPMVKLYLKDGRAVGLSGQQGVLLLSGRELREVDLTGGIEVQFTDYTVRTDRARYQRATDQISSPSPVEIEGRDLQLRGDRMEVDVSAQRLRLFRHVTMTLRPHPAPDESHAPQS